VVELQPSATAASFTTHVLKDGDSFLVANAYGDINGGSDGFFHNDTRLLSTYRLSIAGLQPEALSATVTKDNVFFIAHLTNRPLPVLGAPEAALGLIHIARTRFLSGDRLYERICCRNYGGRDMVAPLRLEFAADFRDMFEVRGSIRPARGELLPVEAGPGGLVFGYCGLDGALRRSAITFSRPPDRLDGEFADFRLDLPANGREEIYVEVGLEPQAAPSRARYRNAAARARRTMRSRQRRGAGVRSEGPLFTAWMER
jgi:glycogen debranching enzyme